MSATYPDRAEAIEQLRRAIEDEGPRPEEHRATARRHRREWPTLWAAIDRLLEIPTSPSDPPPRADRSEPVRLDKYRGVPLTQPSQAHEAEEFSTIYASQCLRCGSLVLDEEAHDRFHTMSAMGMGGLLG